MPDLSIFKLDSQTITIKDTTARQTAESAKTLATAAATAGNAVREQITELKNDLDFQDLMALPNMPKHNGLINLAATTWMYTNDPNYQHVIVPVSGGEYIYFASTGGVFLAFLQSYSTASAPVTSSHDGFNTRFNVSAFEGTIPDDVRFIAVFTKNNGVEKYPTKLVIDKWDYIQSAGKQVREQVNNGAVDVTRFIEGNTPTNIVNGNILRINKNGFTSGTVEIGYKIPDIIELTGSYSSSAVRITTLGSTIEANQIYTFFAKNTDGLKLKVGIADSQGYLLDGNGNRIETDTYNNAISFSFSSAKTGVYAYIRGASTTLNNSVQVYIVKGELRPEDFYIYIPSAIYKNSRLHGKKVAWYGDSITQGYAWCKILNELFEFNGTNCGSGGSRISYANNRNDSMCLATRMQGDYTPTSGVATAIPSDADIIFVEGGTNDWGNNVILGSPVWKENLDNTKYCEACHEMFDHLTTLFPNAEIIVIGTPWAKWANHFTDTYGILNNNGLQTVDYGDMLINVAGRWGIKGINLSRLIGFNDNNISGYTSDGIHPNATGAKVIADVVADYLLSL